MRGIVLGLVFFLLAGLAPGSAPAAHAAGSTVIGDGTPAGCNDEALIDAIAAGGTVTFDCGSDPLTIPVSMQVIASDVEIDGGGLITLSGSDTNRVFRVTSGKSLTLRDITLADGLASGAGTAGDGGLIYSAAGTVVLDGVTLTSGAAARNGGLVALAGGSFSAADSSFDGGAAASSGGAVHASGATVTLAGSTLSGGSAPSGAGIFGDGATIALTDGTAIASDGVGIHLQGGSLTVTGSEIANNRSSGIHSIDTTMTISDSAIADNEGNGIVSNHDLTVTRSTIDGNTLRGVRLDGGTTTIDASTISGNTGGGIYAGEIISLAITNSTISGNTVTGKGGGIFSGSTGVSLRNVTVASNSATIMGGGLVGSLMQLTNTLVADNSAAFGADCVGTFTSYGDNLIERAADCSISGPGVGADVTGADPQLQPLADNGGPTKTHALAPASPAVDAGNPAWPGTAAGSCLTTDQRGVGRPKGAACDIGAYEYRPDIDLTAPAIFTPDDITAEATGPAGAVVTWTASARDDEDGDVAVSCAPLSGSTFAIGDTTVTCTAADSEDNAASASFTITVRDTTAPVIDALDDISVPAVSPSGAVVTWTAPATHDAVDGDGVASCTPASGTLFPVDETTVTCTAVDAAGNAATPVAFTVSVAPRASDAAIVFQATGARGPALPFPSTIAVSGLEGIIDDVVVTLRGVTHTHPDDIDVLLVAPNGTAVALLSDAGGGTDVTGATWQFSDAASSKLLDGRWNASGAYKPSNFGVQSDPFDAPAPAGPWDATLGAFDGGSPNGTWSLYVMDDLGEDGGEIASWELYVTTRPLPPNSAPRVTTLDDVTLDESTTATVEIEAKDDEDDDLTITTSALPAFATFSDNGDGTATIALAPGYADSGSYPLTVTASDGDLAGSETFTIVVNDVNRAPVLDAIDDVSLADDASQTVAVSASDADSDVLVLTTSTLPAFVTFTDNGDGTGSFSIAPAFGAAGSYDITVTASDGTTTASESFTITVTHDPVAPVLATIDDATVAEGASLSFDVLATDGDTPEDGLIFSATGLPAVASLTDNGDGSATFSAAPGYADAGTYDITLTVSDGALTGSETFTLTVTDTPRPPVLEPIGARSIDEGESVTVGISAADPDGDVIALSATGLPAFAGLDDNGDGTALLSLAPGYDAAGSYTLTITATAGGQTDSETLTLTIDDTPRAPVLDPIGSLSVAAGTVRQVTVTASDPDGGTLAFAASGLPAFATLTDNSDGSATLRLAPSTSQAGSYALTVIASDGALTDSETVALTVTPPPTETTPPAASATASPAAVAGWYRGPVTVTLTARDNTGGSGVDSITYAISGATVKGRTTVSGASVTLTIENGGTSTIEYFATDKAGNSSSPATFALKLDTTLPQVTAPVATLASTQLGTTTVPVTVRWTASDSTGSGLSSVTLELATDGGAWTAVKLPTATATSATVQVAAGKSHVFRVRARDKVGNVSADAAGTAIAPSLQRESSNWIVYTGSWTVAPVSGAIGGTVKYGTANSAKATFTFTGTQVAWVSSLGKDRGIAEVWLDGQKVATVDLFKATAQPRSAIWSTSGLTDRDHKLEIRVTGTKNASATSTRVDIDEFIVVR